MRLLARGEQAEAEVATVAESDGTADLLGEAEPEERAVGVGGGLPSARAEAMELQRAAWSIVDVYVGQDIDL